MNGLWDERQLPSVSADSTVSEVLQPWIIRGLPPETVGFPHRGAECWGWCHWVLLDTDLFQMWMWGEPGDYRN